LNNTHKIRGHAHGGENGTELFMVNRGVCALKIYVRGEAVATSGNGIFERKLQVGNGASTGVAFAEAFLGL
jgi:hypothetical protein